MPEPRRPLPPDAPAAAKAGSVRALASLNLWLADVRDGVGPFLAVYLLTKRHWQPGSIGVAMAIPGLVAVLLQTPAGSWVDRTRRKRELLLLASALVAGACLLMVWVPRPAVVYGAQGVIGAATTIYQPVVAAITLGLVGHRAFARQTGRNEAYNHAGNVLAAVLAGLIGYYWDYAGVFYLVAAMCALSSLAALRIRPEAIDHELARGGAAGQDDQAAGFREVLGNRRLRRFAVAVVLFHLANAAMLPLVGQQLALANAEQGLLFMAACIVVAQLVMIPVAAWASRRAQHGRKAVFLIGFLVLPLRGVLYTLSPNAYYLVGVQVLDGIGAGIFGVVSVIMIADLTQGSGRFNFVQGAISTALGIGASLSTLAAGFVVQRYGYHAGFGLLAAVAAGALLYFWWGVEETAPADGHPAGPEPAADPGDGPAVAAPGAATAGLMPPGTARKPGPAQRPAPPRT